MKLMLDHTQRLNLHALLGAQRAEVGSILAIWAIQDWLALDANEDKAIELRREIAAGRERALWDPALSLPVEEFKFTDAEVARIRAALQTCDSYGVAVDRQWLKPIVQAVFSLEPHP